MAKANKSKKTSAIEDEIRDTINWIAVFEEEYALPREVVDQLRKRLEKLSEMVGNL